MRRRGDLKKHNIVDNDDDDDENMISGEPVRPTTGGPGRAERANAEHPLGLEPSSS